MTSSQVILGFLFLYIGYTTAYQLVPFHLYALGHFKCDGKPMRGANVTLQVVYNDTGARPPPWIRMGRDVESNVHRLPKPTPKGVPYPHVFDLSLNSTATDGSGGYLLYGSAMPGQWGVETTLRLHIVHKCYVGKALVLVNRIDDIKDLTAKDKVGEVGGVPIYEYSADLTHHEDWLGREHHHD